jgi:hypothetical protein
MLIRKLLLLSIIGGILFGGISSVRADFNPASAPAQETPSSPVVVYLPAISNPPTKSTIGAEPIYSIQNNTMSKVAASRVTWARHPVFSWAAIEPTQTNPATYQWSTVNGGNEAGLAAASANGVNLIAMVKFTPSWAQKYPGVSCGPVHPNNLDEFAEFMAAAVARYSLPPYNIKYWELGNEPDVDVTLVPPNSVYGCWGDKTKPSTYGGDYYAEMLKVVYPAIKTADPNAQVLIGGLLLDCDPANPPAGKNCDSGNFLKGILQNGGGDYFDFVAFHAYAVYAPFPSLAQPSIIDETSSVWGHLGGTVVGKINYLRNLLSQYGVSKPLILNESALTCPEYYQGLCTSPGPGFYEDQADYLVRLYTRNISLDIKSTIWFTVEGNGEWRKTGLFYDMLITPKPAWNALDAMTSQIADTKYIGTVTQYPQFQDMWGYEFASTEKRVWVLGVTGSTGHTIDLPAGWQAVYDKYGLPITPIADQVFVKSPVYVKLTP